MQEKISAIVEQVLEQYFLFLNRLGDFVYQFYEANSRPILDVMNVFFKNFFDILIWLTVVAATFYLIMALVSYLKKEKKYAYHIDSLPNITIQIPTYNEIAALNCAKRCLDFDYPKEKMQIIIGDDSSDKNISKKIDAFAEKHNILVTRRGNNIGYKPGNLNHMLKSTTGDYIIVFDSDFLPEKDFARRIVQPFSDPNISVVQARWRIQNFNQNLISTMGGTISFLSHYIVLPFMKGFNGNSFLCGSAEIIKKADLIKAGGWKAGSLTEDIECSLRLQKMGKRLIYMEDLECDCEAPHRFKDLCKQQMRWAYGVMHSVKSHFKGIFLNKKISVRDKFSVASFASGYLFSFFIIALTIIGFLAIITSEPAPINWPKFLRETSRNLALTSGMLITSVIALRLGNKLKKVPKMIAGSLTVGLVVAYYVNIGIFKAIIGRPMRWFILKKLGNENEG